MIASHVPHDGRWENAGGRPRCCCVEEWLHCIAEEPDLGDLQENNKISKDLLNKSMSW